MYHYPLGTFELSSRCCLSLEGGQLSKSVALRPSYDLVLLRTWESPRWLSVVESQRKCRKRRFGRDKSTEAGCWYHWGSVAELKTNENKGKLLITKNRFTPEEIFLSVRAKWERCAYVTFRHCKSNLKATKLNWCAEVDGEPELLPLRIAQKETMTHCLLPLSFFSPMKISIAFH